MQEDPVEAMKAGKTQLSDDDITAQALIFFFAGFEASSSLMCLISHELAVNPDVQDNLQKEIDEAFETCGGKLTYEVMMGMKYLDMVVSGELYLISSYVCGGMFLVAPRDVEEMAARSPT